MDAAQCCACVPVALLVLATSIDVAIFWGRTPGGGAPSTRPPSIESLLEYLRNCRQFSRLPQVQGGAGNIVGKLMARNHNVEAAVAEVLEFRSQFRTQAAGFSQDCFDMAIKTLLLGLMCRKMNRDMQEALVRRWQTYEKEGRPEYKPIFALIRPMIGVGPETIIDDHGLMLVPQHHRDYIKTRAILDIGAWTGDSALILSRYGRMVYSFELSPGLFRTLVRVVNQTRSLITNVVPINAGMGGAVGSMVLPDTGDGYANLGQRFQSGVSVPVMTIDSFVREYNETIGYFKIDTEGHGLDIVKGAQRTLREQQPIFGLACYHEWEEMFEAPRLIAREFPEYDFEWSMHGPPSRQLYFNEFTFYAFPKSLNRASGQRPSGEAIR